MRDRVAITILLAACVAGCTAPLRCGQEAAIGNATEPSALDGRLVRCSALDPKVAADDADCKGAWAEARQRILPTPSGK
ncbi:MAG: putative entry exclusion protein TrbK-alt [Bradyrhizobium sp.]|uniref:putative entry exclusion protein TrbK-alt n=1 Tax=unclassified Afipia TaxID=2642050 RepID=UPI00046687C0|nr:MULTISPECIES: putative entry exclusion protein TrbK-alt [unclassified Afipia]MCP4617990.1 putative entry exclusion protein TrbK-alt [Bradyrhizobium sp.]